MPRHDRLYLTDIVDAARDIAEFLADVDEVLFLTDKRTQAAVLQRLMIIGEAARQISSDLKNQHPEVPWRQVAAFRNFAIHEYFSVDWNIVWVAATDDAPTLASQVAVILAEV